ncbi:MAG: hypothetical protein II060_04840 [Bacteroidales bacterium]|nr:hypothetical protein [Bacteroidales bacterium]
METLKIERIMVKVFMQSGEYSASTMQGLANIFGTDIEFCISSRMNATCEADNRHDNGIFVNSKNNE